MPVFDNFDGTYDIRQAVSGEIIRCDDGRAYTVEVQRVNPDEEKWLQQRRDKDNYERVIFGSSCLMCGAPYTFNRGKHMARAAFPKTCKAHRGMTLSAYRFQEKLGAAPQPKEPATVSRRTGKYPVIFPNMLARGQFVTYRSLQYVILNVREHVSQRSGKTSTLLDLAGHCVCCGKEFPCTTSLEGRPLPLRCSRCQEELGTSWRYSPELDTGSPQNLGVDRCGPRESIMQNRIGFRSLEEYEASKQEKSRDQED